MYNTNRKSDFMNKKMQKYAEVLLKTCLKIEKNQPLFISCDIERIDFVRIVAEEAYKLGVKDIYFDLTDYELKHNALKNLSLEDLKKMKMFNKEEWNVYAQKDAAFLMLASVSPGLMKDIDSKKLNDITMHGYETRSTFDSLRSKQVTPWCIAAVPTYNWAKEIFKNDKDPVKKLWETIFEICLINEHDSASAIKEKNKFLKKCADKLNKYQFKTLKYTNELGTDLTIDLPKNHIWASGEETLKNGKNIIVNFPSEEIFTCPDCQSANGIVYSSKPLIYNDILIDDFSITFKEGKAVACKAKKGEETLKNLIKSCPNCDQLGEVALVPYSSKISKSNLIFYETLFDENAACHLALGSSFKECLKGAVNMTDEELFSHNLNVCTNHVDFMIGTKDLQIVGFTHEGKEIKIFEKGDFTENFK